jgi:hypothetical protein
VRTLLEEMKAIEGGPILCCDFDAPVEVEDNIRGGARRRN